MIESPSVIQADFDRLALLSQKSWNHNTHYHHFLLRHIPQCQTALEIGCGTGILSRRLATRSDHVLALDLSSQMLRIAQDQSRPYLNIDFQKADIMTYALPSEHFDCIATIATLHHLPLDEILPRLRQALKQGGTLLVLDLYEAAGYSDAITSAIALPIDLVLRLKRNGQVREARAVRAAWAEHVRHDHYLTLAHLRQIYARCLPGACVRRHLLWRYSVIWKKGVA